MRPAVIARLRAINEAFYQNFAASFSGKRQRLQPGVLRVISRMPAQARVLDLGCGNGLLARGLRDSGHQGEYVGVDASEEMLAIAGKALDEPRYHFLQLDLNVPGWSEALLSQFPQSFDWACMFAALHHIPGSKTRATLLREVRSILTQGGRLALSTWNFLSSDRLRRRLVPWEAVGLRTADVEPGDYLLDWREGGTGVRYVHHFKVQELALLAQEAGFRPAETFFSDGENRRLGLYQIWEPLDIR